MEKNSISRRSFLKSSALAGAAGMVGTGSAAGLLTSCQQAETGPKYTPIREPGSYYIPGLEEVEAEGRELKIALVGCGGQGTGDLGALLKCTNNVKVTALGDAFQDGIERALKVVKEAKGYDVPASSCFTGLDAYKQVIDSGIDAVMLVTPPFFRSIHFQYAVEKGKHVFMEKPLFVDAAGYRSVMATQRQLQAKNLAVIVGTQRHHQRDYVAGFQEVMNGKIGEITGGVVWWNGSVPWTRWPQPGMSDGEGMVRNWVNYIWLSGDHIVEQHVHNLDVFTWFTGMKPIEANGVGSRHRRPSGDMFDNFSIDFTMENGIHVHSMCRQISGCAGPVAEFIQGSKGSWSSDGVIKNLAGEEIWKYDRAAEKEKFKVNSATQLELLNWINHIRAGKHIEQVSELAVSNMMAVMGRQAAYTGNIIKWDEMTASNLDLTPPDLSLSGKMDMTRYPIPVPGREAGARR